MQLRPKQLEVGASKKGPQTNDPVGFYSLTSKHTKVSALPSESSAPAMFQCPLALRTHHPKLNLQLTCQATYTECIPQQFPSSHKTEAQQLDWEKQSRNSGTPKPSPVQDFSPKIMGVILPVCNSVCVQDEHVLPKSTTVIKKMCSNQHVQF